MIRSILFIFLFLLLTSESCEETKEKTGTKTTAETQIENEVKTMYIKDRFLYTAEDEKVILRGVNEMIVWSKDPTGKEVLSEIAKTGANSMRLVWSTQGNPKKLDTLIQNCLNNAMIPMVELHDATGDWSKLPMVLDYWKRNDVKEVMNKHKKWVLLNIANEVGNKEGDSVFVVNYKNAITELRNVGYKMPLIIDAPDWGKDEKVIGRNWKELLNHDPLKNIMFSVHTYWVKDSQQRMDTFLNQVVSENIPFLFGEGPEPNGYDCNTDFPYLNCIKQCQEKEIGWLNWSWGSIPNGDCGKEGERSSFDITNNGKYGSWNNDWGRLTMVDDENSIQKTSIRPASLLKQAK